MIRDEIWSCNSIIAVLLQQHRAGFEPSNYLWLPVLLPWLLRAYELDSLFSSLLALGYSLQVLDKQICRKRTQLLEFLFYNLNLSLGILNLLTQCTFHSLSDDIKLVYWVLHCLLNYNIIKPNNLQYLTWLCHFCVYCSHGCLDGWIEFLLVTRFFHNPFKVTQAMA